MRKRGGFEVSWLRWDIDRRIQFRGAVEKIIHLRFVRRCRLMPHPYAILFSRVLERLLTLSIDRRSCQFRGELGSSSRNASSRLTRFYGKTNVPSSYKQLTVQIIYILLDRLCLHRVVGVGRQPECLRLQVALYLRSPWGFFAASGDRRPPKDHCLQLVFVSLMKTC